MLCVHAQERHNLVKTHLNLPCPWCRIEELTARLTKAEAMIKDAADSWDASGMPYFREQQLRMATYRPFIDAKLGDP